MKFKLPLSLLLIAITIGACKRLDQLVSFNLDTKDQVVWEKAPDSLLTDTILNNELVFFVSEDFHLTTMRNLSKTTQHQPLLKMWKRLALPFRLILARPIFHL